MSDVIYSIEHLKTYFPVRTKRMIAHEKKFVRAVDDVSLNIIRGETLGIVGESGCGKSTLGRSIVRLVEPTSGRLTYNGIDITKLGRNAMREHRKDLQIMFQDPYASLDPRMTVGNIIAEPLDYMKIEPDKETRLRRIAELMEVCGINKTFINRYPHEFSGGQRQRIGIARALSVFPKLIVCDEPVSALDVSIQSQIINLLIDLRKKYDLTLLFISHDLSVVEYISDRVAVMYLGRIIELSDTDELFINPLHPYTVALLESIPHIGERTLMGAADSLKGDIPSPVNPPSGCAFHTRCPDACDDCTKITPVMVGISKKHFVCCLKYNKCKPDI